MTEFDDSGWSNPETPVLWAGWPNNPNGKPSAGPVCPVHGVAWYRRGPDGLTEYACASGRDCEWTEISVE